MPIYIVTRKVDNVEVYRYQADEPVPWNGMEFATHDHTVAPDPELPVEPELPIEAWHITKLAFRNRFTAAEKTALELAALHNPSLAINHQSNLLAAGLRASMADQRDASFINLKRPDTRAGVQTLEAVSLLAPGRAAVILDTVPTDEERYRG